MGERGRFWPSHQWEPVHKPQTQLEVVASDSSLLREERGLGEKELSPFYFMQRQLQSFYMKEPGGRERGAVT